MQKRFLLITGMLLFLFSCKKDKAPTLPHIASRSEQILGTWYCDTIQNLAISKNDTMITLQVGRNVLVFNNDSTGQGGDYPLKWYLHDNDQRIMIQYEYPTEVDYTINDFTDSTLVLLDNRYFKSGTSSGVLSYLYLKKGD